VRWRRGALWVGGTLVVLGVGALLFAASGIYNVAARRDHFDVTEAFIKLTLRRSVALHSRSVEAPPLDDPDMIRLGAGHFQAGCAPCHGAPGQPRNTIVRGMLPEPPDLAPAATHWSPEQLFWIVQNGLKYTGMPAWPAPAREDEVWTLVAFLRQLPTLDAAQYRALAIGELERRQAPIEGGTWSADLLACGRCHDDGNRPPTSRLTPRLAGQTARYLETSLKAYASGARPSGIMQPIATELNEATIAQIAAHYARLKPTAHPAGKVPVERIEGGRSIALDGIRADGVPPCLTCHASGFEHYPRITGQSSAFVRQQLRVFQSGLREKTVLGAIMTPIARRLTEQQIEDVAAFLETLEPGFRLGDPLP
jgi:cytochrome c553